MDCGATGNGYQQRKTRSRKSLFGEHLEIKSELPPHVSENSFAILPSLLPFAVPKIERGMPKILLVEDNEMNRDMLSRRLERKGFSVVMALDGAQGVAMAASEMPDLILMDMSLPVVDGWTATQKLKANPATSAIPVIALTAHAMAGDEQKAREAGCDDYDTKPVELPRLLEKMQALLSKKA